MPKTPLKQTSSSTLNASNRQSSNNTTTPTKSPFARIFATGLTVQGSSPSASSITSSLGSASRFTPTKSRLGRGHLDDDDDDLENVDFETMYLKRRLGLNSQTGTPTKKEASLSAGLNGMSTPRRKGGSGDVDMEIHPDMEDDFDQDQENMTPSKSNISFGFQKRGKSLAKVVDKSLKKLNEIDPLATNGSPEKNVQPMSNPMTPSKVVSSSRNTPQKTHATETTTPRSNATWPCTSSSTPTTQAESTTTGRSSRRQSSVQPTKTPEKDDQDSNDNVSQNAENKDDDKNPSPSVRRSARIAKIQDRLVLPSRTPEVKRAQQRLKVSKKLSSVVDEQDSSEYDNQSTSDTDNDDSDDDSVIDSEGDSDGEHSSPSKARSRSTQYGSLVNRENDNSDDEMVDNDEDEAVDKEVVQSISDPFQENQPLATYFKSGGLSKKSTSDNTLSQLPELNQKEYLSSLTTMPRKHDTEIRNLHKRFMTHFPQWSFELESGMNILFYGYGSKRGLLEDFARTRLTEAPVIIVNGFFPSITVKDITSRILTEVFERPNAVGTVPDQIELIQEAFGEFSCHWPYVYVLIHNIDGPNLRNEKSQTWLSRLAALPHLRMIASIDHIHAPLMWDNLKLSRMNWSWHDLTTFEPYLSETSFENSLLVQQTESLGPRGVLYVLRSLTENAKKVFLILAKHQLEDDEAEEGDDNQASEQDEESDPQQDSDTFTASDEENTTPNKRRKAAAKSTQQARRKGRRSTKRPKRGPGASSFTGLTFHQYFRLAHEAFLVGNEITFRTQLGEFRDHKIIHSRRGMDGVEHLFIPLDKTILQEILDSLNEGR